MADQVNIELLKKQRSAFKGQLTSFKSHIPSASSVGHFESLLRRVQLIYDKYDSVQSKLECLDDSTAVDRLAFEEDYGTLESALRNKIHDFKKNEEATLSTSFHNASFHDINSSNNISSTIRLPEIILPTFSGHEADWLAFRDVFIDLIHSKTLEPTAKFLYLISSIRLGSAYALVENLPVTADNYETAWTSLCDRYNNEVSIQRFHTREIYNIKPPQEHFALSLQQFTDKVSKHVTALKSLKVNVAAWDLLLVHHLTQHLDNASRVMVVKNMKSNESLTFFQLIELLRTRIRVLHALHDNSSRSSPRSSKPPSRVTLTASSHTPPESITKSITKERRICGNCLVDRHFLRDCNAPSCSKCSFKHHVLLHFPSSEAISRPFKSGANCLTTLNANNSHESSIDAQSQSACSAAAAPDEVILNSSCDQSNLVLLGTALINVSTSYGTHVVCRALLDSGSTMNFVTTHLCSLLRASKSPTSKTISGIGANKTVIKHKVFLTISSRVSEYSVDLNFYVLPKITNMVPCMTLKIPATPMSVDVLLADPSFNVPDRIDILLGAEIYHQLFLSSSIKLYDELPPFLDSQLGYIVCGPTKMSIDSKHAQSYISLCSFQTLDAQIKKFWEMESMPARPLWSKEEAEAETHYINNVTRASDGRYCVALPTTPLLSKLGNSYTSAYRQFLSLETRLNNNPEVQKLYHDFISEYRKLGHMTPAVHNTDVMSYYLPHHYVIKEHSVTTKLRVVFNASSRTSSQISLNDCLLVGPTIQQDLFSILLRFRKHVVAFSGDIAKMYRQIVVHDNQLNLQRILWRDKISEPLQVFSLRTVTYGTACAPFLATRTLQQLASDERSKFPVAAKVLSSDFYVDDVLTGAATVHDAIKLKNELVELLLMGGFELRKFNSNADQLKSVEDETTAVALVLGLQWNTTSDHFEILFTTLPTSTQFTKRTILSEICQLFDPFGFCAPIIVTAKLIMQSIWVLQHIGWDDTLPIQIVNRWTTYKEELRQLHRISIPRSVCSPSDERLELHGFCDASEKAYGCVIYTRSVSITNEYKINLLCAKSKVAPLKKETIPRLELCAAVLLAELVGKVTAIMGLTYHQIFLWTDSKITLFRIKSEAYKYTTFVANRITKVQELTSLSDWYYVCTKENPADPVSRGLDPSQFSSALLWWHGPAFLKTSAMSWPALTQEQIPGDFSALEVKKPSDVCLLHQSLSTNEFFQGFQSFTMLVRVTSYIFRFVSCAKNKDIRASHSSILLLSSEIELATFKLVKLVQEQHYSDDIKCLKRVNRLSNKSSLAPLSPFLDEFDIVRVGGRLVNADINRDQKHPILLPGRHWLTTLIVRHEHVRLLHVGPQALLYSLRRSYWIVGGRGVCRSVVHRCIQCFRAKPILRHQVMGDLPSTRVNRPERTFAIVGVDFFGPFYYSHSSRSKIKQKCYVCTFVCFATKAIHLELVWNVSTDSFIACLRRFIGRRGLCSKIYSDNATNFIGGRSELQELKQLFTSQQFQDATSRYCSNQNIDWCTIPPRSPHFGGLWEAAVKSAKHHFKRVVGTSTLTVEEFLPLICQIEACLNSRPLTPLSSDPTDLEVLTPGHFLIGAPLVSIPEPSILDLNTSRLSRFQKIQQMTQRFWKRWSLEYLSELQLRFKVEIGSLVLLHEDNLPPIKWHLGRIVELHPGKDGVVRVVSLKTANTVLKRAVNRISVLPTSDVE